MKVMIVRNYKESDIQRIVDLYNETTIKYNWSDLNDEQKNIMLFKNIEKANNLMKSNITFVLENGKKII